MDDKDLPSEVSKDSSPSSSPTRPSKPPRPPPPNLNKSPSITQHLEALQGLRPERVRWFFKDEKKWTPFNGRDSLAIEESFRKIMKLEVSCTNADPDKPLNTSTLYDLPIVKGGLYEVDVVARHCTPIYWKGNGMAVCRGTWFVGVSGSPSLWQPVSEDDANQVENSHQTIWRAMGLYVGPSQDETEKSKSGDVLGRLNLKGYYVEWKDIADVWLYWDDIKSRIIRGVGTKIGLSSGVSASPIHRGYHTDATVEDGPCDITHLVFVVHGIGQLLHMSNIVRNANDLRTSVVKVLDKKIPGFPDSQRVEFLPVEWRSSLKLDEGTIECITPKSVSGLRNVLNTSMMDIMYYTSPFYRQEIINGVRDEMNRLYDAFCTRNPFFKENNGKVSIIAHSLGSVITYDILSLWDVELRHLSEEELGRTGFLTESFTFLRNLTSFTSGEEENAESSGAEKKKVKLNKPKENIRVELAKARNTVMELEAILKTELELEDASANQTSSVEFCPYALKFKIENLFSIGSPLAVFLALRGIRPQDDVEDHVLPKAVCKKMFNIYHPADPVAYRLEPLISEDYTSIPPIQLHRFDQSKSGYAEEKKPPENAGWSLFNYRVGYNKNKEHKEDSMARSNSTSDESENQDDEVVIVDHATVLEQEKQEQTDGAAATAAPAKDKTGNEKKGGWMSSWFGSPRKVAKSTEDVHEAASTEADGAAAPNDSPKKIKVAEQVIVPSKVLRDRLDYVLREGYMESNYISAVTSHVSYWGSCDVARFVLENTLNMGQNTSASVDS